MLSPALYSFNVSASPLNSCIEPSLFRTVIMPFAASTLTTWPSIFSGAFGPAALPRAEADGWQFALGLGRGGGGPAGQERSGHDGRRERERLHETAPSLFLFGDVID